MKNYIEFIKENYGNSIHSILDGDCDIKKVKKLINSNHSIIEEKDKAGWTPLMKAVHYEKGEIVKELIENGADVFVETKKGTTLYDMATDKISFILISDAMNLNLEGNEIPLMFYEPEYAEIIEVMILEKGMTINLDKIHTSLGRKILSEKIVDYLLDKNPLSYNKLKNIGVFTDKIKDKYSYLFDSDELGII